MIILANPLYATSYYRIIQCDFDSKNETFPTMVLNRDSDMYEFKVCPNSSTGIVNIESAICGELSNINAIGILVYNVNNNDEEIFNLDTNNMKRAPMKSRCRL